MLGNILTGKEVIRAGKGVAWAGKAIAIVGRRYNNKNQIDTKL